MTKNDVCAIDGCAKGVDSHGYCPMHAARYRRYGDPLGGPPPRKTWQDRFWERVPKGGPDACWEWTGSRHDFGYGNFWKDGRTWSAARVSYEITHGAIGRSDLFVCHRCDNPPCCNPAHLFLGTGSDNTADMVAKGRQAKGDRSALRKYPELRRYGDAHPGTKITEATARAAIAAFDSGQTMKQIGVAFGIPKGTLGSIFSGRNWKRLGGARRKGRLRAIALADQLAAERAPEYEVF